MIRHLVFITTILFSYFGQAQNLECCKTVDEVKVVLEGFWVTDDSDTIFRFWFEDKTGGITEMERTDDPDEYLIIDDHTILEVMETDKGFNLLFTELYGSEEYKIIKLNITELIILSDHYKRTFTKLTD